MAVQFCVDWCWGPDFFLPTFQQWVHCLIHIWLNSVAKGSPPLRGTCPDHIWSKSAVWQSPPRRGTFWTTFGQSPQWDKVLQQGAHFGPHVVKVCSKKKSSNKGHILGPHLVKVSCLIKSPDEGHHYFAIFGQYPLCDKSSDEGHHFLVTFGWRLLHDKYSNEGQIFFLSQIWAITAVWYPTLIIHCSLFECL